MTKEFKGNTGAKIVINPANFKEAARLKSCLGKELLKHNIDIGKVDSFGEVYNELNSNSAKLINMLKNILLSCDTSEEFNEAIFECFQSCTWNQIKIREQLFDDKIEAREDYYTIAFECIKENVYPFIKGLLSKLKTLSPTTESSQK